MVCSIPLTIRSRKGNLSPKCTLWEESHHRMREFPKTGQCSLQNANAYGQRFMSCVRTSALPVQRQCTACHHSQDEINRPDSPTFGGSHPWREIWAWLHTTLVGKRLGNGPLESFGVGTECLVLHMEFRELISRSDVGGRVVLNPEVGWSPA